MAQKKYTPRTLDKAVRRYFNSISREVPLTRREATGELDKYGHKVYADVPVRNRLGEPVVRIEYFEPPTVSSLCLYLGIHRSTWSDYAKDPEFSDTATYARGVMRAWNEQELLTRPGKDIRGIEFNLENNFGYRDKKDVAVSGQSVEEFLRSLEQAGAGGQEF